jgi:hypothetical protein
MNSDRYSPDVKHRYRAALAEDGTRLTRRWPFACFGSANAFLALIGPSMGKAGEGETCHVGGSHRPRGGLMRIGHYQHFNWPGARADRWRRLSVALLGHEQYVYYSTAVFNLDWSNDADERNIPDAHLRAGFTKYVWPALVRVRPRLVCALTNRVWDTIAPTVQLFAVPFPSCPVPLPREPIFFRLPDTEFASMLFKSHNHPSRHFLGQQRIATLGKACAWFLRQPA